VNVEKLGRRAVLLMAGSLVGPRHPLPAGALADPSYDARSILLLRLDKLGDLIVSTPAIAAFRSRFPEARITLLCTPGNVAATRWVRGLDEVLVFDKKRRSTWPALLRDLRRRHYDLAFDLNTAFSSTALWVSRLAGARRAASFTDPLSDLWFDTLFPTDAEGHQVRANRGIGPVLGVAAPQLPELDVPPGLTERGERFLQEHGIAGEPVVMLNPNVTRTHWQWPLDRFAAIGDRAAGAGARVVIGCAGGAERERAVRVGELMREPAAILPGDWPLEDYARFLRRVAAFVSTNTGTLHLCEALRVPLVVVCTPVQYRGWRPLGAEHRIVVSPTSSVEAIPIEPVWASLSGILTGIPAIDAGRPYPDGRGVVAAPVLQSPGGRL